MYQYHYIITIKFLQIFKSIIWYFKPPKQTIPFIIIIPEATIAIIFCLDSHETPLNLKSPFLGGNGRRNKGQVESWPFWIFSHDTTMCFSTYTRFVKHPGQLSPTVLYRYCSRVLTAEPDQGHRRFPQKWRWEAFAKLSKTQIVLKCHALCMAS